MSSTIPVPAKFRSVFAERELDHLEKMLRLSRAHGSVPHLDGAYWTARLTFVQEHFDLVAEQSRRVKALLCVLERADFAETTCIDTKSPAAMRGRALPEHAART